VPRPIRASISLGALAHNLSVARARAGSAKVWAVIKANAYGHGLRRAAAALDGADGYALLDFEEAIRLRLAGVDKPILLLEGFFSAQDLALVCQYRLTPVVHSTAQIEMLGKTPLPAPIDAYLKVNSGMNRLGFTLDNVRLAWNALEANPMVREVTLMTHFADADGKEGVEAQLAWFDEIVAPFAGAPRSLANSAALLRFPETRADWVRPGIMLYGCSPFRDHSALELELEPAMTLRTEIVALQRLHPRERVGYGFTYEAAGEMTLGVAACGYADGYPRHAPSGTPVLVDGVRTRSVGLVSMDMICVDLTGIPGAGIGSQVTLWGEGLPADEVAASAGTLSYELLCALALRVPVIELP
jgi:alanine racemase